MRLRRRACDPGAAGVLGGIERFVSPVDESIGAFARLKDREPDRAGLISERRFGANIPWADQKKAETIGGMANASVKSMSQWASTSIWNAIMAEKASVTAVAADPWRTFSNASG